MIKLGMHSHIHIEDLFFWLHNPVATLTLTLNLLSSLRTDKHWPDFPFPGVKVTNFHSDSVNYWKYFQECMISSCSRKKNYYCFKYRQPLLNESQRSKQQSLNIWLNMLYLVRKETRVNVLKKGSLWQRVKIRVEWIVQLL